MSLNVEEFINPKTMITPGIVATMVATVSGAFFSMFGFALPACLLFFSFFIGCMVFFSKEFKEQRMTKLAKVFLYVINSIIIFAMATGTHAVLDKSEKDGISGTFSSIEFFIRNAYAEEPKTETKVIKQKKPFFYNWTKSLAHFKTAQSSGASMIEYDAHKKNYGSFKNTLVKGGIVVPVYEVKVKVDQSKTNSEIKAVTYKLPSAYFDDKQIIVKDKRTNFEISLEAWKPFVLRAEIELETGKKIQVETPIIFNKMTKF